MPADRETLRLISNSNADRTKLFAEQLGRSPVRPPWPRVSQAWRRRAAAEAIAALLHTSADVLARRYAAKPSGRLHGQV